MANFSPPAEISTWLTRLKFCCDYMTNSSLGWNISLGTKYETVREESWENQAAILLPAFQPGWNFFPITWDFFSPGRNSARVENPSLVCQAWAELHSGLKKSPCNRQFDFKRICFRSRAEILHVIRPYDCGLHELSIYCVTPLAIAISKL